MMMRRRPIVRTAVVAGTATAVSNRVSRRQANRWDEQNAAAAPPPQQYAEPQPAPTAPPSQEDQMDQLRQLGELHSQGILTDEEFSAKKAQILGL